MKKFFLALAIIGVSLIFFGFVLAAQPTKMSLQGKVEGLSTGDLGVKISDQNSCLDGVFFDHNYTGAIQDSTFNLLLGDLDQLNLNYNQDYWLCLSVNGSLVDGPNNFRGGQGQIGVSSGGTNLSSVNPGSVLVANSPNVWTGLSSTSGTRALVNGSGSIFWSSVTGSGTVPVFSITPTITTPNIATSINFSTPTGTITSAAINGNIAITATGTGKISLNSDTNVSQNKEFSAFKVKANNFTAITGTGTVAGLTKTLIVRKGDDSGSCFIDVNAGIITASDC